MIQLLLLPVWFARLVIAPRWPGGTLLLQSLSSGLQLKCRCVGHHFAGMPIHPKGPQEDRWATSWRKDKYTCVKLR